MADQPNTVQPNQQLFDEIYRERVLRARRSTPAQKFCDGFEMFEFACIFMRAGIKAQNPDASEYEISSEMKRRFRIQRRLHELGVYQPACEADARTEAGA